MINFRVGQGYDVHQLVTDRDFWLGGILIPHTHGALGHSDADVLIHAICDALLGAANLRDIGFHFSDKDPQYKDIDSKVLLKQVVAMLQEEGYQIGNVDATVCLEQPKVNPHIPAMKAQLANIMGIAIEQISIKATTSEKMGFVGRAEGITASTIALIYRE
ncbi:MAG: 2-C-methyl-D-erythritol 2,4-cyclodiphosphate synthase [Thermonemataceae bacterium]